MAKRKESAFNSWEEVDENFKRLAELQVTKQKIEGEQTIAINEIKAKYSKLAGDVGEEIKEVEKNIALFAEAHRDEFAKKRSKKLTFGTIAFRMTTRVVCGAVESAIKSLKALNLDAYIRVKEELDKDALLELEPGLLSKAGISIKREDKITIEPDYVQINSIK